MLGEFKRIKKKRPEIYEFALQYLATNPKATHNDVVSAIYKEFGRKHVAHSNEIHTLADAAYFAINKDQTSGLPLFERKE